MTDKDLHVITLDDNFMVTETLSGIGEVNLTYEFVLQSDRVVVRGINNNNQYEIYDFPFNECEVIL